MGTYELKALDITHSVWIKLRVIFLMFKQGSGSVIEQKFGIKIETWNFFDFVQWDTET